MSLFDDISKAISKFLQEPPKPLVTSPPCKNCYYIKDNLCTKRNMPIEYDRTKICPYFTQEQPVTSMPTSLTESDIALLREALGKEITLQILDDINTYGAKESTLQSLKTDVAKELTLQTINTYGAKESTLQSLKTKVDSLYTDVAKAEWFTLNKNAHFDDASEWDLFNATISDGALHLKSPNGSELGYAGQGVNIKPYQKYRFLIRCKASTTPTFNLIMDLYASGYDNPMQEINVSKDQISSTYTTFSKVFDSEDAPSSRIVLRVFTFSTVQIDVDFAIIEESVLPFLKTKIDSLYTDVTKQAMLTDVRDKLTSLDGKVALQTTLNVLKTDIADMKATMGALSGIKIFSTLEHKGGAIDLNEVIYTTESSILMPNQNVWYLIREFNISTPTPPTGITVLKYVLQVSIEIKGSDSYVDHKIVIDGIDLATFENTGTAYVWFDRSKEVTEGSHTVQIYGSNDVNMGTTSYVRGTRGICGVGTNATSDTKIVVIETLGEGKFLVRIGGKCWKETTVTIYGTIKFDESPIDKVSDSVAVTVGGTEYTKDPTLTSRASSEVEVYAKTSVTNVPVFGRWSETKMEKYYIQQ